MTKQDDWRDAIAHLASKMTTDKPEDQGEIRVDFMSRKNPDLGGRMLVRKFSSSWGLIGLCQVGG